MNCPDCGSKDLESNGEPPRSPNLTMLCLDCGNQWEPHDEVDPGDDEDAGIQRATSGQLRAQGREWE